MGIFTRMMGCHLYERGVYSIERYDDDIEEAYPREYFYCEYNKQYLDGSPYEEEPRNQLLTCYATKDCREYSFMRALEETKYALRDSNLVEVEELDFNAYFTQLANNLQKFGQTVGSIGYNENTRTIEITHLRHREWRVDLVSATVSALTAICLGSFAVNSVMGWGT